MVRCVVASCPHYQRRGMSRSLRFYVFPTDEDRVLEWKRAAGLELHSTIKASHRICSDHFAADAFTLQDRLSRIPRGFRRLNATAVPTLKLQKTIQESNGSKRIEPQAQLLRIPRASRRLNAATTTVPTFKQPKTVRKSDRSKRMKPQEQQDPLLRSSRDSGRLNAAVTVTVPIIKLPETILESDRSKKMMCQEQQDWLLRTSRDSGRLTLNAATTTTVPTIKLPETILESDRSKRITSQEQQNMITGSIRQYDRIVLTPKYNEFQNTFEDYLIRAAIPNIFAVDSKPRPKHADRAKDTSATRRMETVNDSLDLSHDNNPSAEQSCAHETESIPWTPLDLCEIAYGDGQDAHQCCTCCVELRSKIRSLELEVKLLKEYSSDNYIIKCEPDYMYS